MSRIITVESLNAGDRFEFITSRSEWADNCFLPHPKGVIVVAKSAFIDPYKQCRFGWRHERYPDSKPEDWWGVPQTRVRLLDRAPPAPKADEKKPTANEKKPSAAEKKPAANEKKPAKKK